LFRRRSGPGDVAPAPTHFIGPWFIEECPQQRRRGIGDIVRALVLLWERLESDEMVGQVKYP